MWGSREPGVSGLRQGLLLLGESWLQSVLLSSMLSKVLTLMLPDLSLWFSGAQLYQNRDGCLYLYIYLPLPVGIEKGNVLSVHIRQFVTRLEIIRRP